MGVNIARTPGDEAFWSLAPGGAAPTTCSDLAVSAGIMRVKGNAADPPPAARPFAALRSKSAPSRSRSARQNGSHHWRAFCQREYGVACSVWWSADYTQGEQ